MNARDISRRLESHWPCELAEHFVLEFVKLRQAVALSLPESGAAGRLVETAVQMLQYLERNEYDQTPRVDEYLRTVESRNNIDDGLRICSARIARAIYAVRSKRGIAHKNNVDASHYDLKFQYHSAQWILTEFIRTASSLSTDDAGRLVELVNAPLDAMIEDCGDHYLVLSELSTPDELLLLIHRCYPERLSRKAISLATTRRKPKTVSNTLRELWRNKLVIGSTETGYKLTRLGFNRATSIVRSKLRLAS